MQIVSYEQTWVEGLNQADVSVADKVFAADCVIHINGAPDRNLNLAGFKQMVAGLLAHAGIRSVFLVDGAMLLIFGVAVRQVMEEPTGVAASPAMEDA